MIDRIKMLMNKKNISATQFSEEVGVQRSALSHVLSGRNKPSLDFMLKIKSSYPEIELDWLLLGNGKMIKDKISEEAEKKTPASFNPQTEIDLSPKSKNDAFPEKEIMTSFSNYELSEEEKVVQIKGANNKPSYILLVYPDGTFERVVGRQ